jgi:hypothetical protein
VQLENKGENENQYWQWTPNAEKDDWVTDEGAWVFRGRQPDFRDQMWSFVDSKPELTFRSKDGKVAATKITTDADGNLLISKDSQAAALMLPKLFKALEEVIKLMALAEKEEAKDLALKGENGADADEAEATGPVVNLDEVELNETEDYVDRKEGPAVELKDKRKKEEKKENETKDYVDRKEGPAVELKDKRKKEEKKENETKDFVDRKEGPAVELKDKREKEEKKESQTKDFVDSKEAPREINVNLSETQKKEKKKQGEVGSDLEDIKDVEGRAAPEIIEKEKKQRSPVKPKLSPLALGFLASELVTKRDLKLPEMGHRFCKYMSGACADVRVELWARRAGQWEILATQDKAPERYAALLNEAGGFKDVVTLPSQRAVAASVVGRDGKLIGAIVIGGQNYDLVSPAYVLAAGEMVVGILLSAQIATEKAA